MSTPLIESIADNIKTAIAAITTANGYNQTLNPIRPKRLDFMNPSWNDLDVLICQAEAEELTGGYGTKEWRQYFEIGCIVIDSDTATTPIDTRLNQVASDIFKKLLVDTSRSGLAIDTNIHEAVPFIVDDSSLSGIIVKISVDYRVDEKDPYTRK